MEPAKKKIPSIEPSYDFIFGYLEEQKPFTAEMFDFVIGSYERTVFKNKTFRWLLGKMSLRATTNTKYIFVGRKYADLLQGLPRKQVMVIGFMKDWIYCIRHRIPFSSGLPVYEFALQLASSKSLPFDFALLKVLPSAKAISDRYVILQNDSLPADRIYCLLASRVGARTICIQHGVFTSQSPARVFDGGVADKMLVFDRHQFNILLRSGVPKSRLNIIGFHSDIEKVDVLESGLKRRLCILGQPWEAYYPDIAIKYHELLEKMVELLKVAGYEFTFKPHPNEHGANYLRNYGNLEARPLQECFACYDVFISFTSTALIEVTLANRVAIQIFDPVFMADRFDELGYAHTINSWEMEQLADIVGSAEPLGLRHEDSITERFYAAMQSMEASTL